MRTIAFAVLLLTGIFLLPAASRAEQQPEIIVEKMTVKLLRGLTNCVTSVAEIPKQTVISVRDMGGVGYVAGPLKGIGMTVYRAFIGATETAFFLVPQPGYYDPMIDPPYVWEGWGPKRGTPPDTEQPKE